MARVFGGESKEWAALVSSFPTWKMGILAALIPEVLAEGCVIQFFLSQSQLKLIA
jgi:hypothetical protein